MISVKNPNCAAFLRGLWLRHLKTELERLRLAILQVVQAKFAIDRWTRNH